MVFYYTKYFFTLIEIIALEKKKNFIFLDKDRESGVISPKSFDTLARDMYDWAQASGNIGQVCTFYELSTDGDSGTKILPVACYSPLFSRLFISWLK